MGGLISTFMAANQDSSAIKYKGMITAAPYFDLYDKEMLSKMKSIVEVLNKVSPNKMIPLRGSNPERAHLKLWKNDELNLGDQVSPHNILENEKAMSTLKSE